MYFKPMWILIVLGVMVSSAVAALVPVPDVDGLTQASTLIVVGELASVQRNIRTATVDFSNRRIRALADPDSEIRYYGVLGLARLTEGDGAMIPSMEQFRADELKYVSYWREKPAKRELQTSPAHP
jgi:hypothetical protein